MTYYERTMKMVRDSGMTAAELSRATGLKQRWMSNLFRGEYPDPSVNKIETINNYLTKELGGSQGA